VRLAVGSGVAVAFLAFPSDAQSVHSWGWDAFGQVTNSPTGAEFAQVSGGTAHSVALGLDGSLVQVQLWYRDPLGTSNRTTSLSDALEFPVEP